MSERLKRNLKASVLKRSFLIVPNKRVLRRAPENVEVLDCRDALKLART